MDYRDVIDDFVGSALTERRQMEAFVRSMARHPGLSLDNQVLLYLQEPEAPRCVVSGAYLEAHEITRSGQVALMRQVEKDGRPFLMAEFMYVVRDEDDPEGRPDVSIRKLCSDRGLVILRRELPAQGDAAPQGKQAARSHDRYL